MRLQDLKIVALYLIVLSTYCILFIDDRYIVWLCKEDGPIESMGAIFFITASLLFLAAYIFSSGSGNDLKFFHTTRNIFYLLLGILFLVCFGEEISWGQRLLNWETPRLFSEMNAQGEINIHNLWLFHERRPDGTQKSTLAMALNMWKLFCVFWLSFCVVVPIIDKVSLRASVLFKRIGVPIAPLWIGALFLTHAVFFHIVYNYLADLPSHVLGRVNELKESNYAFIFVVFAYEEMKKTLQSKHLSIG